MGSHYSQCFATRQTIAPGDKCYAIAITQQSTYGTVSLSRNGKETSAEGISHAAIRPDAYWTTVGNFIEGRYDINGDIDVTESDENFRRLLAFCQLMLKNAFVTAQGENTTHDLPFDFPAYVKENCPAVQTYLDKRDADAPRDAGHSLSKEDKATMFQEMVGAWTHTDDVAFKHRVFYADYKGRPRPLQFTLLHGKTYDAVLGEVSPEHTAEAYADKALAYLDEQKASGTYPQDMLAEPRVQGMVAWVGPYAVKEHLRQLGEFDGIRYNEELLGFEDFGLQYLRGKLPRAKLHKLMVPVLRDRLVVHLLESYEIKIQPKSIRYEDDKNHIGKGYADLVASVSEVVAKRRKRAR
jgi:hypothetical protein